MVSLLRNMTVTQEGGWSCIKGYRSEQFYIQTLANFSAQQMIDIAKRALVYITAKEIWIQSGRSQISLQAM